MTEVPDQPQSRNDPEITSFDDLLDRYEKPVFNLIYRLVGDYEEAADLTQDTFVAAYRSFHAFRRESSVFTWLCQIAVNRCRNRFKERDRRRRFEFLFRDVKQEEETAVEDENGLAADHRTPLAELERKELQEKIESAISSLPDEYRMVVVLRDLQGLSYQEISEVVGLRLEVVKARLHRGRAILRTKLSPYLQG